MHGEAITQEQIKVPSDIWTPVVPVGFGDRRSAVSVVTSGFSTDPVARWVYPTADEYLTYFPLFIKAFAGKAFEAGTAFVTRDMSGAALWLPPGVEPDEEPIVSLVEETVDDSIRPDLYQLFDLMARSHPVEPHWYLPMIAVDTFRQGRGAGSLLLSHTLAKCDEDGLPAYLESSNPRNISLYRRFGFEIVGEIQAGGSPPMYAMLRPASIVVK